MHAIFESKIGRHHGAVERGQADITVERGTEYLPFHATLDVPANGAIDVDIPLTRWISMPEEGRFAGNTHVHYDETETRALDRLRDQADIALDVSHRGVDLGQGETN